MSPAGPSLSVTLSLYQLHNTVSAEFHLKCYNFTFMNRVAAAAVSLSASMSSCVHVLPLMFAQLPLQVFIALAVLVWWLFPVVLVASPALFLSPPLVLNLCIACFIFLSACHDKLHRYSRPQRTCSFPGRSSVEPGSVVDGWW